MLGEVDETAITLNNAGNVSQEAMGTSPPVPTKVSLILTQNIIHLIFSRFKAYLESYNDSVCKKVLFTQSTVVCGCSYFLPV